MEIFLLSYLKRSMLFRRILVLIVVLSMSVTVGYLVYDSLKKELKIVDGDTGIHVKTMGEDVETVFDQVGILVESYDYVSVPLGQKLSGDTVEEIQIKRAVPVNIQVEGRSTQVMTYYDTIGETISANGIVLGPLDRIYNRTLNDPIEAGMDIRIIRVKEEQYTETEPIPYAVVQVPNENMNRGEQKIMQAGVDGTLEKYYKLTYEDGKIVSKEFMSEKVVSDPVEELVEFGTVPNFKTSRGDVVRYSKVIEMNSTAYTSSYADTGKNPDHPEFGVCYTGLKAREGIIAVDPKVIPLYTKVYVEVVGSAPDYGFAIAGDIGSAIKGNLIDIYLDSREAVAKWGKKKVKIYILKEQNDTRWKNNTYSKK